MAAKLLDRIISDPFPLFRVALPVEGLLMDTVSGGLPILFLDMHPWTATLFTSFATMKTVHDHCGYPPSCPEHDPALGTAV